ncbi:MAG: MFS transporter [Devosia sp.]
MSFRSTLALLKVPHFAPSLLAMLLTVLAEALAGTFMALLAVQKIGMSPIELTLFMTLASAAAIGVTTLFGHFHDKKPVLWPLLLALAAKAVGFVLCALVSDAWALITIGFTLLGLGSASFSLVFAIAKGHLDQVGGDTVARGMASLRMMSSLAWAIGPAMGAILVAFWSFEGIYFGAASLALLALVTVIATGLKVVPADLAGRRRVDLATVRGVAPVALALTAFQAALFMSATVMSIVVVQDLGTEIDVGLLFSLCAACEVVIMALFVMRPVARRIRALLLIGFAILTLQLLLMLIPSLPLFFVGMVPRAVAIAIIAILGMNYVQDMLPGRPGAAAAVYGNAGSAGALVSGLGTGLWAGAFGFWSVFGLTAALAALGLLAILISRPPEPARA